MMQVYLVPKQSRATSNNSMLIGDKNLIKIGNISLAHQMVHFIMDLLMQQHWVTISALARLVQLKTASLIFPQ